MTGSPRPTINRPNHEVPSSYRAGPTGPVRRPRGSYTSTHTPSKENLGFQRVTQADKPQKLSRFQNWYMRNPRKFHAIALTIGLSIFFSRPIYDIFFRSMVEGPPPMRPKKLQKNILN